MPKRKFSKGCVHKYRRDEDLMKRLNKELVHAKEPRPGTVLVQHKIMYGMPKRIIQGKEFGPDL